MSEVSRFMQFRMSDEGLSYQEAYKEVTDRGQRLIDKFNPYLQEHFGDMVDIRRDFLLDGSAVVSREHFKELSPAIRAFFMNDRVSITPNLHVFNASDEETEQMALRAIPDHVGLRGARYYGYDGKYEWGPDEEHSLEYLGKNLEDDINILPELVDMEIKSREDYLTRIGIWDYVRNDLSSAYYLKRSQHALEPREDDQQLLQAYERILSVAFDGYFDAITMRGDGYDVEAMKQDLALVRDDVLGMKDFVKENKDLDIVRAHRELANPQSLQFAFHLVYDTDKVAKTDLIAGPLYGSIDVVQAVRYTLAHGDDVYRKVTGEEPPFIANKPEVLMLQQKISRRGTPRSQIDGVMKALPRDFSVIDRADPHEVEQVRNAQSILCIDDSVGTFGSSEKLIEWINSTGEGKHIEWVAAHGGVRWAEAQGASLDRIAGAEAVAVTPLTKKFKQPHYQNFSPYMPDHLIARESLLTNRTVLNIPEVVPVVDQLHEMGIVDGVGFDLYETLLKRTVTLKERRNELHRLASEAFSQDGYVISPDEYGAITRPIWRGEITEKEKQNEEIDMYQTVWRMVTAVMEQKDYPYDDEIIAAIVRKVIDSELEYEISVTVADDGVREALQQLKERGIPIGLYSNTPYPRDAMLRMIEKAGISDLLTPENCIFSSDTGVMKPAPQSMAILAERLGVPVPHLGFVGNSYKADVGAASKAKAIPIWRLFPGEHPHLEKQITDWRGFKQSQS